MDPAQWQLLERLAPHLQRAVAVHEVLARARCTAISIGAADEAVGFAVFLLAKDCRILFANAKAEDLVRSGTGFHFERGRLAAATRSLTERLHSLVGEATSASAHLCRSAAGASRDIVGCLAQVGNQPFRIWLRRANVHASRDVLLVGAATLRNARQLRPPDRGILRRHLVYAYLSHLPRSPRYAVFMDLSGLWGIIFSCSITHFMEAWTIWHATYWLSGYIKLLTAASSVATAIVLPFLVPKVLTLIRAVKVSEERREQLETAHYELAEARGRRTA
jgi:hypothetical protein